MNEINQTNQPNEGSSEPTDRLNELFSLYLDDGLDDQQAMELNELLLSDTDARARSMDLAQLHADLYTYFGESKESKKSEIAPALNLPLGGMGLPTT